MNKITDLLKILLLISAIVFTSCSSSLRSGKSYVVENVFGSGYVIKLKGVDELFTVNDKLKIGDTITAIRTFKRTKVTIY